MKSCFFTISVTKALRLLTSFVFVIVMCAELNGQAVTLPYFCGFEDPVENANWTIVKGNAYANNWTIGTAEANFGTHSLYISPDNGATAGYTNSKGSAIAYRTFNLPAGRYQVDFDWMALGNGTDEMYVSWVTSTTENIHAWATNNNGAGAGVKMFAKAWQSNTVNGVTTVDTVMSGYATWQHGSFEVSSGGSPIRLVFFWTNSQTRANNPGGCIDNVQINLKTACPKPTNLSFSLGSTQDEGILTWSSNANSWDVRYKNSNDLNWTTHTNVSQRSDTIKGLTKGIYTFWVRAHCDDDTSSWAVITNVLVYTSLAVCVDYINLDGPNVTCASGNFSNPHGTVGKVDYGPNSGSSRHTIHYGIGGYDSRTGNGLPTVPRGEVASVRLGNWSTGAQAESITYDISIDSSATILLLKYAVVLEDPNHSSTEQPRFRLELLDQAGNMIDPTCGVADFIPGTNTSDWHVNGSVKWKDWTTMGLNLSQYVNQTIRVRFITFDCSQSGHYGYAYFTLDCAEAELEGETCGGATTTSIRAPEGFAYQWYAENDPSVIVSTDRYFTANENDTSDYICRAMLLENPGCYFEMRLSLLPKWPVSSALSRWAPKGCKNYVEFINKSFINSNRGVTTDIPSTYYWTLSDGQTSQVQDPKFQFPNEGGQYTVTLVSSMAEDQCMDTLVFNLNVPPILSYDEEINAGICEDGTYIFNKKPYTEEGVYVDSLVTYCGCDSILTLNLKVYSEFKEYVYDTICEGMSYNFNGYDLYETGIYTDTLMSSMGCDSIVTIYLQVNPVLSVTFDPVAEICADDANFIVNYTPSYSPTSYEVRFGATALAAGFVDQQSNIMDNSIVIPLPSSCAPDYYSANILFYDSTYFCGNIIMPMNFAVLYPDSIFKQKFNNVLSLKNSEYNGGFNFSSYQWYKNGVPLTGETSSYIYLGEGVSFNSSDNYRVAITRADGSTLMSCEFAPVPPRPTISVMPSIVGPAEQIRITILGKGEAKLWTPGGLLLRSVSMSDEAYVSAPSEPGVYLLQVVDENDRQTLRIVVTSR